MHARIFAVGSLLILCVHLEAQTVPELRIGHAQHAFDHLGDIGDQAEAAAACGETIIYSGGLGEVGYLGLPPEKNFPALFARIRSYGKKAKAAGIELNIGYLCATSIVKLDTFDKNWSDKFRRQFKTRPAEWLQQDRHGKPLPSWYGGDYRPACMNNPDWRAYEHTLVRAQLETGHDGIFFDNPTVHPQGCYCPYCMKAFAKFLKSSPLVPREEIVSRSEKTTIDDNIDAIRARADMHHDLFLRFRTTIARDFLADVRAYARTINPKALITCNNSLNDPSVFYSQAKTYGYNIEEMSKAEDFVVVEDMNSQPRTEPGGRTIEYGPTYKMLHAINHGKPVVAVTVANGDYHTAPNLVRLAIAEAAANESSYLMWPTWPDAQRKRMIAAIRPMTDFMRRNESLLNDAPVPADLALYLPFERWVNTDRCAASALAAALTKENIQYKVVSENDWDAFIKQRRKLPILVESRSVFSPLQQTSLATMEKEGTTVIAADQPDWLARLRRAIGTPLVKVTGPPTVRAVLHEQPGRWIVHLYNLNVQRLTSFDDTVIPANDVKLTLALPQRAQTARFLTPEDERGEPALKIEAVKVGQKNEVASVTVPRLDVCAIVVIEP